MWVLTKRMNRETPAEDVVDGVPVRRVPPEGPRKGTAKWRLVPRATAALLRARHSFDLILCVDYRGIGAAALAAGRLLRTPVVFDAETPGALSCANWDPALKKLGISAGGRMAGLAKWPARRLYGAADAYACISRELEQEVLDRGVARQRVWYLPHTVDTAAFRPPTAEERQEARRRLSMAPDRQVVAFVGRLGREKGILDLLEAWRSLDRADATLLVVGPDMPGNALDVGAEVRAMAAEFPAGRVALHGPTTDVRPLLAAADLFVQPSHYEAFGLSVIEAMAAARPIVATRVGGMAEYLRDGHNALLCAPHDPQGLARQMARLLDDRELARTLGVHARWSVEDQFDEQRVTAQWVRALTELSSDFGSRHLGVATSWILALAAWVQAMV